MVSGAAGADPHQSSPMLGSPLEQSAWPWWAWLALDKALSGALFPLGLLQMELWSFWGLFGGIWVSSWSFMGAKGLLCFGGGWVSLG